MTEPTGPTASPDPHQRVRNLVVLLLRAGLGINLLNAGLLGYMSASAVNATDGFQLTLVYLQIFIGLALILGIFTLYATILAGIFIVTQPLMPTILMFLSGGMDPAARGAFAALNAMGPSVSNLLIAAAVLWFSPTVRNPWSLDALILGRREVAPRSRPKPEAHPLGPESTSPPPGERTSKFLSGRGDT